MGVWEGREAKGLSIYTFLPLPPHMFEKRFPQGLFDHFRPLPDAFGSFTVILLFSSTFISSFWRTFGNLLFIGAFLLFSFHNLTNRKIIFLG